jgi:hypothetical protein
MSYNQLMNSATIKIIWVIKNNFVTLIQDNNEVIMVEKMLVI